MPSRRKINPAILDSVLLQSARRCCLCYYLDKDFTQKEGQVAHLDHDAGNGLERNLAFLCLRHHALYDSRTTQNKNYTVGEVRRARSKPIWQ